MVLDDLCSAAVVSRGGVRSFTRERIPPWCGLPVPGTWALRITTPTNEEVYRIDTKRMYTISSSGSSDIKVLGLDKDETISIFHHRSDGQVYVSARGDQLAELDGAVLGSDPVVFEGDIRIGSDIRIELVRQGRGNGVSVREALRSCQTDDEATKRNTVLNGGGKRRGTPIRGVGTPLSGYRPRKRVQKNDGSDEIENKSSVRFIDFSNI